MLNARQIRQDSRLKEGGTLRANNGEQHDRVTLVTEELRVHGEAEAAKSQDEVDEVVEPHGNERMASTYAKRERRRRKEKK